MHAGEALPACKFGQKLGINDRALLGQDDNAVRAISGERGKGALNILGRAKFDCSGGEALLSCERNRVRGLIRFADVLGVVKNGDPGEGRHKLAKHGHALRHELGGETSDAGEIAAWPRKAGNKAGGDRIATKHDDRNPSRPLLPRHDRLLPDRHDDSHLRVHPPAGQAREFSWTPVRKAVFHHDPLAFGISEFAQTILEHSGRNCGPEAQITDFRKPFPRLCKSGTEARKEQGGREKRNRRSSFLIELESSESHSVACRVASALPGGQPAGDGAQFTARSICRRTRASPWAKAESF